LKTKTFGQTKLTGKSMTSDCVWYRFVRKHEYGFLLGVIHFQTMVWFESSSNALKPQPTHFDLRETARYLRVQSLL
jgi:hypothetical protein